MEPKYGFINNSLDLMAYRLGLNPQKRNINNMKENIYDHKEYSNEIDQSFLFKLQKGESQQSRMIFDKKRSLDRALWYSYQGANLRKVGEQEWHRGLINPNKLKQDYDDKILSINYMDDFKPGDVFEWMGTKTYWLIYLQDLDELAYFRGDIRKCSYEIEWEDENGRHSTYAAVRGPVETKINYIQKHQISVDTPNHSLSMLLPRTKENLEYFKRYSKFYLQGLDEGSPKICWRVEATDWISTPGILEVVAVEYYSNESEDNIEEGIVGGLIVKDLDPNLSGDEKELIEGETFIKPKKTYDYKYKGLNTSTWSVDNKYPVKVIIDENDPLLIHLKWDCSYSGEFELKYGKYTKTIVVESLF